MLEDGGFGELGVNGEPEMSPTRHAYILPTGWPGGFVK
jgi:hypothetical protein